RPLDQGLFSEFSNSDSIVLLKQGQNPPDGRGQLQRLESLHRLADIPVVARDDSVHEIERIIIDAEARWTLPACRILRAAACCVHGISMQDYWLGALSFSAFSFKVLSLRR